MCNRFDAGNSNLDSPDADSSIQTYDNVYDANQVSKGNEYISPGVERVDIIKNTNGYKMKKVWTREDITDTSMIKFSTAMGYLYGYWHNLETGFWGYNILDFETGKTILEVPVSDDNDFNDMAIGMINDIRGNDLYCPTNKNYVMNTAGKLKPAEASDWFAIYKGDGKVNDSGKIKTQIVLASYGDSEDSTETITETSTEATTKTITKTITKTKKQSFSRRGSLTALNSSGANKKENSDDNKNNNKSVSQNNNEKAHKNKSDTMPTISGYMDGINNMLMLDCERYTLKPNFSAKENYIGVKLANNAKNI